MPVIRVSIEVADGTARFRTAVQAESIQKALSMAGNRYPNSDLRVLFPIEPDAFFVEDPVTAAALVEIELPERVAG